VEKVDIDVINYEEVYPEREIGFCGQRRRSSSRDEEKLLKRTICYEVGSVFWQLNVLLLCIIGRGSSRGKRMF